MRTDAMLRGLLVVLALAGPAAAAPLEQVVGQLEAQGYEVREVKRTWLSRVRVERLRVGRLGLRRLRLRRFRRRAGLRGRARVERARRWGRRRRRR